MIVLQIAAGVFLGMTAFAGAVALTLLCLFGRKMVEAISPVIERKVLDSLVTDLGAMFIDAEGNPVGKKPRPWSRRHARCIDCKSTKRKHHARGRCTSCNSKVNWRNRRTSSQNSR